MPVRTTAPPIPSEVERPGGSYRERDGQESQHSHINDYHKYMWLGAGVFNNRDADLTIMGGTGGIFMDIYGCWC